MGFKTRSTNTSYWNVKMGGIVRTVRADTAGAVPRTNKNGDTVYEIVQKEWEGLLSDISIQEGKFGPQVVLNFVEDGHNTQISMNPYSNYGRTFLMKLPNMNLEEKFTISPYEFTPENSDRVRTGVSIFQNGEKIMPYWTQENPGKKPDWEETTVKGKKVMNNDKEIEYLLGVAQEQFIDKFESKMPATDNVPVETVTEDTFVEEEDDMPF